MVECPQCFGEVVGVANPDKGVGRVGWWCENCQTLYPDDDYVKMKRRPLGMPR